MQTQTTYYPGFSDGMAKASLSCAAPVRSGKPPGRTRIFLQRGILLTAGLSLLLVLSAATATLQAQHIGFGLSFGDGVELNNLGSEVSNDGVLNITRVLDPPALLPGVETVTVSPDQNEDGVVIIEIRAPVRADVTVTVTAPPGNELLLDEGNGNGSNGDDDTESIPFQIGWGYWNHGNNGSEAPITISDFGQAKEVVSATGSHIPFMSATFPVSRDARGSGGPPPPPPTPDYEGRNNEQNPVEMASAFLLVYGSVGPVTSIPQAGTYTGTIDIHVELSTYEQP